MGPMLAAFERHSREQLRDLQTRIEVLLEAGIIERERERSEKAIMKMHKAARYCIQKWEDKGPLEGLAMLLRAKIKLNNARTYLKVSAVSAFDASTANDDD
ncbi:hypothetical protein VNI00_008473 [Paramarasmius palmivorus]|uniref:Uncharacterized protein n=1 Tax=Paramarasmius palmivorus TaxID=297713 RepID=A0AAW0CVJ5_9AGAR